LDSKDTAIPGMIGVGFGVENESAMSKLIASEPIYEVAHNTVQMLAGR